MAHYSSIPALVQAARDGAVPAHLSDWTTVDQERIRVFADATDDHQWIHVDAARAARGPFGTTIAHGYLTLALLPALLRGALEVDGTALRVNYGLDRVRFTAPVPSGSRVRARASLLAVEQLDLGTRVRLTVVVEIEGEEKPALVAEQILLLAEEPS